MKRGAFQVPLGDEKTKTRTRQEPALNAGGRAGQMMIARLRRKFVPVKGIGAGKQFFAAGGSNRSFFSSFFSTRS
jgi:hypothetical protein